MTQVNNGNECVRFVKVIPDAMNMVDQKVKEYPLISTIAAVALAILGLLLVLKFSIVAVISGALLIAPAALMAKTVIEDPKAHLENIKQSFLNFFSCGKGDSSSSSGTPTG